MAKRSSIQNLKVLFKIENGHSKLRVPSFKIIHGFQTRLLGIPFWFVSVQN